jgi:RHS repeat-associated protein
MQNIALKQRLFYRKKPKKFTVKELDAETGLYYYGARYLDPKTSRWLSGDPAMGEYFPVAPVNDEAKKHNGNLPGQGGVFNYVNLHAYHYAGNNPVKLVDPDGRWGSDVHYYKTRVIAITLGFSPEHAAIIAKADNDVDHNRETSPFWGDQSWHFNTYNHPDIFKEVSNTDTPEDSRIKNADDQMKKAVEAYNAGDIEKALIELGKGLHALQDIDAHGDKYVGFIPVLRRWSHHPLKLKEADDTRYDSERYKRTIQRTEDYLKQFKEETRYEQKE